MILFYYYTRQLDYQISFCSKYQNILFWLKHMKKFQLHTNVQVDREEYVNSLLRYYMYIHLWYYAKSSIRSSFLKVSSNEIWNHIEEFFCTLLVWNPLVYIACWMTPLFMNDWVASSNDYMENVGSLSYAASKCGHISLRKKKKKGITC